MKLIRLSIFFLMLVSCTTPSTTIENQTLDLSSTSTPISTELQPTETTLPAPNFPVTVHDTLPLLENISAENIDKLIPVASFSSGSILQVKLSEKQDKILFISSVGIQEIDLAAFEANRLFSLSYGLPLGRETSPDGQLVAELLPGKSNFWNMQLIITDIVTGNRLCNFDVTYPDGNVRLIFHDNTTLSLSGFNQFTLWNVEDCKATFQSTIDSLGIYDISSDGKRIALSDMDSLYIYEGSSTQKRLLAEIKNLRGAHFLPDGNSIVVTSKSGNAIYNLENGERIYDFPGNMGEYFTQYNDSQDGKWILINAFSVNRLLNLEENKIYALPSDFIRLSDNPLEYYVDILAGNHLITKDYIWSIELQAKIVDFHKYSEEFMFNKRFAASADGNYFAISSTLEPHFVDVFDLSNRKVSYTLMEYYQPLSLPDGKTFIATRNGKTSFFSYTSEVPLKTIDLHYTNGLSLADGTFIVWDDFGNVSQIDPITQSVLHATRLDYFLTNPNIQNMTPEWSKEYDFNFDTFLSSFMDSSDNYSGNNLIETSHNYTIGISQTNKNFVQMFSIDNNQAKRTDGYQARNVIASIPVSSFASAFAFSPDDTMIAGVFIDKIFVWDTQTGDQIYKLNLPANVWRVYDIAFTPDNNKLLISASEHLGGDNTYTISIHRPIHLRIIDLHTDKLLYRYTLEQDHLKSGCNIALPFVINSSGTEVITITPDCKIGIYDIVDWQLKKEFGSQIQNANIDISLSPDDVFLAVAYKDKLEVWNVSSGDMIKLYTNPDIGSVYPQLSDLYSGALYQVAFSPDGNLIGTRFSEGFGAMITLWGIPSQ